MVFIHSLSNNASTIIWKHFLLSEMEQEICMPIRTIFLSTPDLTIHILVNYANINLLQALRMEFKHHSKVLFCHIWRKRSNLNEIRSHLVEIFGCRPLQKVIHDKLWQHANDNLCVLYCHLHLVKQNQYKMENRYC